MKQSTLTLSMVAIILAAVGFIIFAFMLPPILGLFPFGPIVELDCTVNRLYVDVSGSKDSTSSHYMVGTDRGVFECDNSLFLWIWDADERYARLEAGGRYRLTIKGRKFVNFFFQVYPGIISIQPL